MASSFDAPESGADVEPEVADEPRRHTRPFRAWGAAHERESGPSVWERFVGWLRSIFSRKTDDDDPVDEELELLDAAEERNGAAATLGEAEPPANDDFADSVDATREPDVSEPEPVDEPVDEPVAAAPAVADADPLWDEPAVSDASAMTPPTLEAQDFADVWSPRDEVAEPIVPDPAPAEPPKKGFFARLFSWGKKDDPAAEQPETVDAWASNSGLDSAQTLEPADADFADNVAAAEAPTLDDFADENSTVAAPPEVDFAAEQPTFPPPSTDHSAEDSANLAALLGPITPRDSSDDVPTEIMAAAAERIEDVSAESPEPMEEPAVAASVDEMLDVSLTVDSVSEPELIAPAVIEPEPEPLPVLEPAKKPGFFSSLLKRVSRSQFIPKAAVEPEPPPAPAMQAASDFDDTPSDVSVVEVAEVEAPAVMDEAPAAVDPTSEELEARWGPPAAPVEEDLGETVPTPRPAVPHPLASGPASDAELQATQPFPAFRDARDDFAEEAAPVEAGRATEKVEIPAFDEGEKTDEFEIVPPETEGDTAETRQVAGFWARLFGRKVEEQAATPVSGEVAAAAVPADDRTPFVLAKFRTFYNEVIRDKHQKSDVISGFATAVMGAGTASEMADPEFAAQLLSKRLSEMLELQAAESNWTGGDAAKYYPEAQYAMVALADETFATIDWPGRSSWHKYMLEPRMYGTRGADIEFFKRIDKLLKEAPNEKGARDLARLYLMVIASGFRGKYRVPNVRRPLAEYRRRLYEYSHQADPLELYARERRIFPELAEHTLASRAVGRFTPAQKWVAAVLVLALLYLGFSHYAWTRLSADLKDIMSRIESTDSTGRVP